jgi:hypothetical protein
MSVHRPLPQHDQCDRRETPSPTFWGSRGRRFKSGRPDHCLADQRSLCRDGKVASRSFDRTLTAAFAAFCGMLRARKVASVTSWQCSSEKLALERGALPRQASPLFASRGQGLEPSAQPQPPVWCRGSARARTGTAAGESGSTGMPALPSVGHGAGPVRPGSAPAPKRTVTILQSRGFLTMAAAGAVINGGGIWRA